MNTDASILVYKFRSERTGLNMYAEYTQLQLTFLVLYLVTCNVARHKILLKGVFAKN